MTKKVYLVRHGESEDLVQKLHQKDDSVLSERGNRQAKDVACRFSKIPIDIIFTSPYIRTMQTAQHISDITGAKIKTNTLLRERRQPSEIIGKGREEDEVMRIKEIINDHRNDPGWHYSDEENFFELRDRVVQFQIFIKQQSYSNILLVSHAVFIKVFTLLGVFGDLVSPDIFLSYYKHVRTSQTGITMLEWKDEMWKLLTWNDYAHLGEDNTEHFYRNRQDI